MACSVTFLILPWLHRDQHQAMLPTDAASLWDASPRYLIPLRDQPVEHSAHALKTGSLMGHFSTLAEISGLNIHAYEAVRSEILAHWTHVKDQKGVFALSAPQSGRNEISEFPPLHLHDFAQPARFREIKPRIGALELPWLLASIASGQEDFSTIIGKEAS